MTKRERQVVRDAVCLCVSLTLTYPDIGRRQMKMVASIINRGKAICETVARRARAGS